MPVVAETQLLSTALMATPALSITVTNEATGYPKAYVNNNDLDRFFKFTNVSATRYVTFDFGAAVLPELCFLWTRNFAAAYATGTIVISYSSNGSTWSGSGDFASITSRAGLVSTGLGQSRRYWRLEFDSLAAVPEIAMIAFCKKHTINQSGELPNADGKLYRNRKIETESGRSLVNAINSRPQRVYRRKFTSIDGTIKDTLVNAFDESGGTLRPVIFLENSVAGANDGEPIVCRFTDDLFERPQTSYEFYELEISLMEIPSIPTGFTL